MRSIFRGVIAAASVALLAVPTVSAAAANDPATAEEAGYQLTNAQFSAAHATVYLRQASQYSGSVAGLGQSIQFWGGGNVYVLGVSDSTTTSPWSPAVAIFDASSHALVCSTSGSTPCPGTPQSWLNGLSYPAGHTVTLKAVYDKALGVLHFTVRDETAGTATTFTRDAGTGIKFDQVRIGTEFGNDPWSAPSFTAPTNPLKTAAFTNAGVTNYKGKSFDLSDYFTTKQLTMTGAGSVVQARPSDLVSNGTGFSTFLVP